MNHAHADHEPCGPNCPVGGADGTRHQVTIDGITLCTSEPFSEAELAALRQHITEIKKERGLWCPVHRDYHLSPVCDPS